MIAVWHHEACRVMTNRDLEGRIFLSYPHTNNGFFFLLIIAFIYLFRSIYLFKISFQKSLKSLTLLDVLGKITCPGKIITIHHEQCPCRINRIHHWCSVGTEKSQPEGPSFKWETRLAEFPTERWTRGLGFFWNH